MEPRKRCDDRRPLPGICLRSRSSIVACSMKQMHIGGALFGGAALRRAHSGLHIYLYTRRPRACARCWYTLQDTLRRRVFTYQSDDGLSHRGWNCAIRQTDRARGREFSSAFRPVVDLFRPPLERMTERFSFTAPRKRSRLTTTLLFNGLFFDKST